MSTKAGDTLAATAAVSAVLPVLPFPLLDEPEPNGESPDPNWNPPEPKGDSLDEPPEPELFEPELPEPELLGAVVLP
jgi:hypothetical protein